MLPEPLALPAARTAGWVTLVLGSALLIAPAAVARVLGISDEPADARTVGAIDLALALPLLLAPRRGPFMAARAAANMLTALRYSRQPSARSSLFVLTVVDALAAARLLRDGT